MVFFILSSYITSTYANNDSIFLNQTNVVSVIGEINSSNVPNILFSIQKLVDYNKHTNINNDIYLFLDTPGGSVEEGAKIIMEVVKHDIKCIAKNAFSMGFVIFQACKERLITPFTKLMQHQMSYMIFGNHQQIISKIDMMHVMNEYYIMLQSYRIGISVEDFKNQVYNDWWIFGKQALDLNCADKIVDVHCNENLTNSLYSLQNKIYSYCPLINGPI